MLDFSCCARKKRVHSTPGDFTFKKRKPPTASLLVQLLWWICSSGTDSVIPPCVLSPEMSTNSEFLQKPFPLYCTVCCHSAPKHLQPHCRNSTLNKHFQFHFLLKMDINFKNSLISHWCCAYNTGEKNNTASKLSKTPKAIIGLEISSSVCILSK